MKNEKILIIGAAFGVAIGSVIDVLTDNLALWISLGIAIGAGIGISLSHKQKKDNNDKNYLFRKKLLTKPKLH
ncbi:MAG: hypothetical protein WBN55_08750 [Eudoraea sp.]|uniref:hypothetical protein n=1 Tax=Eudoraea sp. TaxID=1979955 RepID=UPI003C729A47